MPKVAVLNIWERRTLVEALFHALQEGRVSHRQDAQELLLKLEMAEKIRIEIGGAKIVESDDG
jgi:hypothetical protein